MKGWLGRGAGLPVGSRAGPNRHRLWLVVILVLLWLAAAVPAGCGPGRAVAPGGETVAADGKGAVPPQGEAGPPPEGAPPSVPSREGRAAPLAAPGLAGPSSPAVPSGSSSREVAEDLAGLRPGYLDYAAGYRPWREVRDPAVLALLREYLRASVPGHPPAGMESPYGRHVLSFTLQAGGAAPGAPPVETPQYTYTYNDLSREDPGYIEFPDNWRRVPGEFNILLEALAEYPLATGAVDPADAAFLKTFGWTSALHISTLSLTLPERFLHRAGEYPTVLYWAYNNELNRDAGLDLAPFLGQQVEVRLYKVAEPLPPFMEPRREAGRAVLVRCGGRLVGAWMDAGRHYSFACSLRGRPFEEVAGLDWPAWTARVIDPLDPREQELARLSPEELIRAYYAAIDRGDYLAAHACESRRRLTVYLFSNMDNQGLYNPGYRDDEADGLGNISAARVLGIERREYLEAGLPAGAREYEARLELEFKVPVTSNSGLQSRFVQVRQETPGTGWRIEGCGTGP